LELHRPVADADVPRNPSAIPHATAGRTVTESDRCSCGPAPLPLIPRRTWPRRRSRTSRPRHGG
jgi:hypothetical protein